MGNAEPLPLLVVQPGIGFNFYYVFAFSQFFQYGYQFLCNCVLMILLI